MVERLDEKITDLPEHAIERGCVAFVLGLGVLDYWTGAELFFSVFYFIPIAATAWYGAGRAGYFIAGLATLTWWGADLLAQNVATSPRIILWNAGTSLLTFLIVAALVFRLRKAFAAQRVLALSDPLTGLANTRAFLDRLTDETDRALRYGRVFTMAYLDLDHFKSVNDTLGHTEGDEVLRSVADVMKEAMRTTDLTARLGGDEFGLLLPETPYAKAGGALDKLRNRILEAMASEGWPVTVSIGAVTFESPVDTADHAIRLADRLMYDVKDRGGDGIEHMLWTGGPEGV